jgi:hypothetical protein
VKNIEEHTEKEWDVTNITESIKTVIVGYWNSQKLFNVTRILLQKNLWKYIYFFISGASKCLLVENQCFRKQWFHACCLQGSCQAFKLAAESVSSYESKCWYISQKAMMITSPLRTLHGSLLRETAGSVMEKFTGTFRY